MLGFILAAGFGTRLRPLTEHVPKALVQLCGEPLLKRSLDLLNKNNIERIAVNAHYLAEQIFDFRDASGYEFKIFHEKGKIKGTGGAFPYARPFLSTDDAFCVINADIISNADLKMMSRKFLAGDSVCMLVAAPAKKGGSLLMAENSDYGGIVNKESNKQKYKPVDFIGITFYKKEFLNHITEKDFSIVPLWKRLQEKGLRVTVHLDEKLYWQDTGTPQQFAQAHFDALSGKVDLEIPSHYNLNNSIPAAIANTHREDINIKLQGPCWIGSANLDEVKLIKRAVILDNSRANKCKFLVDKILTPWGEIPINE